MQHRRSAGYSLTELLIVISIIGILSLITVPVFMNFQRQSVFKNAMRTVATDLRGARTNAIKTTQIIRVEFTTGAEGAATREYQTYASSDNGATWTAISTRSAFTAAINDGSGATSKRLEGPVWFEMGRNLPDIDSDGKPDIFFRPNGTSNVAETVNGGIVLATNWTDIYSNRYNIYVSPAGQVRALPAQCMDGIDNELDGRGDRAGVDMNKDGTLDLQLDPNCSSAMDNDESA